MWVFVWAGLMMVVKPLRKKSPFHKFHGVFFADVTWKKGVSRLVPPHGSKLQRAFREIYPGDVCWTIRCREKLFHGIVWALWKGWLWRKKGEFWLGIRTTANTDAWLYIYLINWIWYSWETAKTCNDKFVRFKKQDHLSQQGRGSSFFWGVKIVASLASLENSKWPWYQVEESKTFLHFLDTGGPQVSPVEFFEDKLDLPLPVTTRMTLHLSVRESQPKPSFATKILGGG